MIAAIYSRKSIFTGKGESIENQISLCREYCEKYLNISEFITYEDEGYSGGNLNRPQFQKLINDLKEKKFNVLICYRLDRISRNVADFSSTLKLLQDNNIDFVSIKEQFDTTTPMGRAMVYISSVFAQLERETIAERVKDNMLQLAKTGRWLGGQTPYGYSAERVSYFDEELKERSLMKLTPIEKELKNVQLIFNKYLELHSITQVVKYLNLAGIKGKNAGELASMQIRRLLSNPLYVKSSEEVQKHLTELGINVYGVPNGNGYLTYNKTKNITSVRDIDEWICAVGKHPGIIDACRWLEVQKLLDSNKCKRFSRLGTSDSNAMLTGILKCAKCNCNMIVKQGHVSKRFPNIRYDYYVCSGKEGMTEKKCTNKNIRVDYLDKLVINKIKTFSKDLLIDELEETVKNEVSINPFESKIEAIKADIFERESSISNLIKQLSLNQNHQTSKYIFNEIEKLHNEISQLKVKLKTDESTMSTINSRESDFDLAVDYLINRHSEYDALGNIMHKRTLLKTIVEKIFWDGESNTLRLVFKNDE